ncbi:MAG TPA: RHS repeat-associated core domain-containing protein [Gemmatimonadaceae bacterium]|nr:RHS repeat-associated core domain-containing protein [Gemmatimonadaceae bacterium]
MVSLHALGIDAPVAVRKTGRTTLVPRENWQGDYEIGTTADGTPTSLCNGATNCPLIEWPGGQENADGLMVNRAVLNTWWGSLISEKLDASGMKYMRNRYYSPETGQFTQQDPIGLAGGMNLYGFANSDPVNFSDPMGLCPPLQPCPVRPGMFMGALLNGGGQVAENPRAQHAALFIASILVPEETAAGEGIRLYRAARGAESATRLGKQAADAEAAGLPHGISVTANAEKFRNPEEAGPGATLAEIEEQFQVKATPSRADPTHHTVVLPKPVTSADATKVNNLFREKGSHERF